MWLVSMFAAVAHRQRGGFPFFSLCVVQKPIMVNLFICILEIISFNLFSCCCLRSINANWLLLSSAHKANDCESMANLANIALWLQCGELNRIEVILATACYTGYLLLKQWHKYWPHFHQLLQKKMIEKVNQKLIPFGICMTQLAIDHSSKGWSTVRRRMWVIRTANVIFRTVRPQICASADGETSRLSPKAGGVLICNSRLIVNQSRYSLFRFVVPFKDNITIKFRITSNYRHFVRPKTIHMLAIFVSFCDSRTYTHIRLRKEQRRAYSKIRKYRSQNQFS